MGVEKPPRQRPREGTCVGFLQEALPRLNLRWEGFRKVRRQVCRRIARRLAELGLADFAAYRQYLESHPEEWQRLESCCRVTISRFYRDPQVFRLLTEEVLPELAERAGERGEGRLFCWSAGCASGEEPYTLSLLWEHGLARRYPGMKFDVFATDVDPQLLARAGKACYQAGSLRDLPPRLKQECFCREKGNFCLKERYRQPVRFAVQDIRHAVPDQCFDLICCRNLAFTYFSEELQRVTLERLLARLLPGGALVVGKHEHLPPHAGLAWWAPRIHRRVEA